MTKEELIELLEIRRSHGYLVTKESAIDKLLDAFMLVQSQLAQVTETMWTYDEENKRQLTAQFDAAVRELLGGNL